MDGLIAGVGAAVTREQVPHEARVVGLNLAPGRMRGKIDAEQSDRRHKPDGSGGGRAQCALVEFGLSLVEKGRGAVSPRLRLCNVFFAGPRLKESELFARVDELCLGDARIAFGDEKLGEGDADAELERVGAVKRQGECRFRFQCETGSEWASRYELTFSLWLERAECEFLIDGLDRAEQLIVELLRRGARRRPEPKAARSGRS